MTQDRGERTRAAALSAAIDILVESGITALTTRAAQTRSDLSRGAFLHHFPTREHLLAATVEELVNRRSARADDLIGQLDAASPDNRLRAAIATGRALFSGPDLLAEMELWQAARTDPALRSALEPVVHRVNQRLADQLPQLFGREIAAHPRFPVIALLTLELAAGMAMLGPLRGNRSDESLLDAWAEAAAALLGQSSRAAP